MTAAALHPAPSEPATELVGAIDAHTVGTCAVVDLTPELAKALLEINQDNYRALKAPKVQELADAMRRGEFSRTTPSNDAVTVASTGLLANGQHRCAAVVRSGVTIRTLLLTGVPDPVVDAMDRGTKRSASDALSRHGFPQATSLAAAIRQYPYVRDGKKHVLTDAQILTFARHHGSRVLAGCQKGEQLERAIGFRRSIVAGLHFLLAHAEADVTADEFFDLLKEGDGLYRGHPVFALRTWLLRRQQQPKAKRGNLDPVYAGAITLKTWNAMQWGTSITTLRWGRTTSPEEYPKAIGVDYGKLPALVSGSASFTARR